MSPRRHAALASAASAVVGLLATLALVAPSPSSGAGPAAAPLVISNAQLAWGLNDESNNKAFAPGTYNFLSAGRVPDPGRPNQNVVAPGVWQGTSARAWWARQGEVTLQKRQPDGSYATATFAGLSRDVDGNPLTATTGPFSQHRVVVDGGTGTVDPDAGTATIRWSGSFSVVYYSGYSFFTVSDPVLQVTPTTARLRATLSGYASSRTDSSVWQAVPPRSVVLADLPRDGVDLSGAGFSVAPAYLGVRHTAAAGAADQVRSGEAWGAFPASFLAYLDDLGSSAFWYSTGGASDAHKVPKPITVSYEASAPVVPTETPTTSSPTAPTPTTTVNPLPPATVTTTVTATATVTAPAPAAPPVAAPSAPAAPSLPTSAPFELASMNRAAEVHAREARVALPGPDSDRRWTWWLGSALLLAAAALTLLGTSSKGQR